MTLAENTRRFRPRGAAERQGPGRRFIAAAQCRLSAAGYQRPRPGGCRGGGGPCGCGRSRARFPAEAFAAVKAQRLLGILVPADLGGEGAAITDVVETCYALARACASTGMIFAMHQIMVACLVRNALDSAWHRLLLRRLCDGQLLLASSTTDGQGGGDLRKSDCAVVADRGRFTLAKNATVMSYGAQADAIVATARRTPDAPPTDQVLVAIVKDDYTRASRRLGYARHARNLQRRLQARGFGHHRADFSGALSPDPPQR